MSGSRTQLSSSGGARAERRFLLTRRNLFILAAAVAVLVAGYLTLAAGHPSARGRAAGPRVLRALPARHRPLAACRSSRHGPCAWTYFHALGARAALFPGRIAQLVQSACLTRRMSGVRIPLRPLASAPIARWLLARSGPILCGGIGMFLVRLVARRRRRGRARWRRSRRRASHAGPDVTVRRSTPRRGSWWPTRSPSRRRIRHRR